jgi:hypothetical protein
MRGQLAGSPVYIALLLAGAAALLSAQGSRTDFNDALRSLMVTTIAPEMRAIAGAIGQDPAKMILP